VLGLFEKKGKGSYAVQFLRGPYVTRQPATSCATVPADIRQSPLYEPLQTIGFSDGRIRSILRSYSRPVIELWSDITLAKIERDGRESFTNCPEAYFIDNMREASQGRRTPPDWWREDRRREEERRRETELHETDTRMEQSEAAWKKARAEAFKKYVAVEVGRDEYERAVRTLLDVFGRTMPPNAAMERAIEEAERHFITGFRFPDIASWVRDHSRVRDEK
jgi:hypothetical protein